MADQPIDVNNPILPGKHRDRWITAMEALKPRMPWDLTPEELREAWGEDLAAWHERHVGPKKRRRAITLRRHPCLPRVRLTIRGRAGAPVRYHLKAG